MADYPTIAISELKPYENNARMHPPEQIEKIANSIKEFGFITPVIVDENNMILVGHGRTEAAKVCGMESVPFRRITNLTDEQKRAYILVDNRLSDIAEWDEALLQEELQRIDMDMTQFGFEEFDFNIDERQFKDRQPDDEVQEIPATKVMLAWVSSFGANSEILLQLEIPAKEGPAVLERIKTNGSAEIVQQIKAAILGERSDG